MRLLRGVRHPDEVAGLRLKPRMLVRIGSLLKKGLAVTVPVLESAAAGSALESFLLTPAILERAATLDANALRELSLAQPGVADMQLSIAAADDGVRVLCLQEELDVGDAWGAAPSLSAPQPAAGAPAAAMQAGPLVAIQGQPPALAAGAGGAWNGPAPEALFSRPELERWRLRLVTAAAVAERMEAMRTLALAPLSQREKLDVLLQGLSDRDAAMRAEAAGLLPGLGADQDIAAALAALNHAEPVRRMAAVDRLLRLLAQSGERAGQAGGAQAAVRDLEIGSAAVCVVTMLRYQFDAAMTAQLLEVLRACAGAVGRDPERVAEVVRVVTGLLAAAAKQGVASREAEALLTPALRLLRALAGASPQALLPALQAERERCTDSFTEASLLQVMLDIAPAGDDEEQRLLTHAVSYIGRETEEGRDSRAVGTRLARRGERALLAVCDGFAAGHPGAQRYFLILFDDLCRLHKISPAGLERAAQVLLRTIETGSKAMRMAAMECRFVTDSDITEETRQALAKAFLDHVADFTFRSDIEKAEGTLARLGLPALPPLLERLTPERAREERVRAVRMLGEWALNVKAPRGQIARLQLSVTDVLRRVQALSLEQGFPDRGELLCALGKLVASPAASREADAVITRNLLDAAKSAEASAVPRALEGLSYVAASRRAQADVVHATAELLRHVLDETPLEISTDSRHRDGETVIEITGGERYTSVLPIIIEGMSRVACSSSCPPPVARDLAKVLLGRWKKIAEGELIWGPANTALLVRALRDLGCHRGLAAELRLEILKSFAPRHVQTHIMHALTEILAADDSPTTAVGAVTIGYAILGRRSKEGQFPAEDRADILRALARIVGRRMLGGSSPEAQQQAAAFRRLAVDELFKGVSDLVPNAYEALANLRTLASVPGEVRTDIDRRLKEYEGLVLQ